MSEVTLAQVRATLRTVSRVGQSQAESMCAWPTAESRWALARAGNASAGASSARATACGAGQVGDVEPVHRPVEGTQQVPAASVLERQLGGELAEDIEVLLQLPDLGLEDGELGAGDAVERVARGGGGVAHRGGPEVEAAAAEEQRVGGGLDVEVDLLAAGRRVGDADPLGARVQPLDDGAVGPVDEPLRVEAGVAGVEPEVEAQVDDPAGEPLRSALRPEVTAARSPREGPTPGVPAHCGPDRRSAATGLTAPAWPPPRPPAASRRPPR